MVEKTAPPRPSKSEREFDIVLRGIQAELNGGNLDACVDRLLNELPDEPSEFTTARFVQVHLKAGAILYGRYQFDLAYDVLARAVRFSPERVLPLLASASVNCSRTEDAASLLDEVLQREDLPELHLARASLYLEDGNLDAAGESLQRLISAEGSGFSAGVERDLNYISLVEKSAEILEEMAQPDGDEGLVVICNDGPFINLWATLPALMMRRWGYATICSSRRVALPLDAPSNREVAELHGLLSNNCTRLAEEDNGQLHHDWTIDWSDNVVQTGSINAYQGLFERLSTVLKKYTIDIDAPEARGMFDHYLLQCDRMLSYCERVASDVASNGTPVRFLVSGSHFAPYFVLKEFCLQNCGSLDMQCVTFYPAYEHYYNNLGNTLASCVSVINDTRSPERRSGLYADPSQFDAWIDRLPDPDTVANEALNVLDFTRTGRDDLSDEGAAVLDQLRTERLNGRKIAALFGKIVYDMAVPYEGGPAHRDMVDWLNHSIESVADSNTLLLIKPHPHEAKTHMHQPAEWFLDLIDVPVPSNVILLGHHWLNMRDLLPYLDCGILWHGTSALELGMAGVPVIVASHWGRLDHPIDFVSPDDRDDYVRLIRNPSLAKMPANYARRCALLSKYLASDEVMIPFPYATMPVLAPQDGSKPMLPSWRDERVRAFLEEGDSHLDRIVNQFS